MLYFEYRTICTLLFCMWIVIVTTFYENLYVRMCSYCNYLRWKLDNVDEFSVNFAVVARGGSRHGS